MLTRINSTIKIADDNTVVLEIARNDLKKFKEYKHPTDSKKFYADFLLNNQQLCITGVFKENQKGDTVTMPIFSANKQGNGKASTILTEIKNLFGLNDQKKEAEVKMLKIPENK